MAHDHGLVIDTSIKGVSLAIIDLENKAILCQESDEKQFGSGSKISQFLQNALLKTKLTPEALNYFVISPGPGSFTGIRVGLSWLSGFAAPRMEFISCAAIPSLQAALSEINHLRPEIHSVLMPSTKTHGYLSTHFKLGNLGKNENLHLNAHHSYLVDDKDENGLIRSLSSYITNQSNQKVLLIGKPWPQMEKTLLDLALCVEPMDDAELQRYALKGMINFAFSSYEAKDSFKPSLLPTPNYLRKSSAEERLEQKD